MFEPAQGTEGIGEFFPYLATTRPGIRTSSTWFYILALFIRV